MGHGMDVRTLNTYNPTAALFENMASTSGTASLGWMSSLNDLKMIQSGAYKKALKSVYDSEGSDAVKEAVSNTISKSGTTDSEKSLSNLKSDATTLYNASKELRNTNYDTASDDDIVKKVESFVNSYNKTLNDTKNLDSYSILQTQVWAVEKMESSESMLNKAGIKINDNNTLSLDKEALKSADKATLKTLFSGSSSLADDINQKASALINQATNQISANTGSNLYDASGSFQALF
ncbi:MAG: hypothetical protein VZQ83_01260 [Eubacterium sp.]|nr:hypothetical protein [Eubacterium sp.]